MVIWSDGVECILVLYSSLRAKTEFYRRKNPVQIEYRLRTKGDGHREKRDLTRL